MNTDNTVMWVILQNNADWDCFKILTLRKILMTHNPLLVEHCAFLEVIHLFQKVGCARNKHQFRTVQQNLFGHWIEVGWVACCGIMDLIVSVFGSVSQISDRTG